MSVETREIAPGLRDLAASFAAAGSSPAATARSIATQAVDDLVAAFDAGVTTFDCADIYTGVEELYGALRARLRATRGEEAARAAARPHQAGARSRDPADDHDAPTSRRSSTARSGACASTGSISCSSIGGTTPSRAGSRRWAGSTICAARASCELIGGTNFDTPPCRATFSRRASRSPRCRFNIPCSTGGRRTASPSSAAPMASRCSATARWRAAFCPTAGSARPSRTAPLANRSLVKYKLIIEDFGGWALFQELLRALRRVADRHGADIASVASRLHARPSRRRRGDRRRDLARPSRRQRRRRRDWR